MGGNCWYDRGTCGHTLVPCLKQCKDDIDAIKCLLKKDLEEHCPNRDHECQYCGKKSPYAYPPLVLKRQGLSQIWACKNCPGKDLD